MRQVRQVKTVQTTPKETLVLHKVIVAAQHRLCECTKLKHQKGSPFSILILSSSRQLMPGSVMMIEENPLSQKGDLVKKMK